MPVVPLEPFSTANANPQRPGMPIEPFGLTEKEAKTLVSGTQRVALARPPLGDRVRRYTNTGGATTKTDRDILPPGERLRRGVNHTTVARWLVQKRQVSETHNDLRPGNHSEDHRQLA